MAKYEGLDCILLIDDDNPTNFIHEMVIETTGIETYVKSCDSGECALSYLNNDAHGSPKPGIIFLDINMPGMNGWEFLDQFEKLSEQVKSNIVVAMLTTSVNPDDAVKAEQRGSVNSFFSKPLRKEYIEQLIKENFNN